VNGGAFAERLGAVTEDPGVYLFREAGDRVIYVGKALSLKSRLRSYQPGPSTPGKQAEIVRRAESLETIVTRSELEALILERNLIARHRPRFNVLWRDNKGYPYLELLTGDEFPRVRFVRRKTRKDARYYGPYTAGTARRLQAVLNRVFRIPSCRAETDGHQVPCLYHHLGWCAAPCAGLVTREDYAELVSQARAFLEGRGGEAVPRMREAMEKAAAREDFEDAARLRDRIRAVEEAMEGQAVMSADERDADVLGLARSGSFAAVALMAVRGGRLQGKHEFTVRRAADAPDSELVASFLEQHFAGTAAPPSLLLPCEPDGAEALGEWLSSQRGGPVALAWPRRGRGAEFLELAQANARAALITRGRVGEEEAREQARVLEGVLGLPEGRLQRIEGIDLSRMRGDEAVGAVVVFRDGLPSPQEYRRYIIRMAPGDDDYAGMSEVVRRRLKRAEEGGVKAPDLLLLDGGAGHLSAVSGVAGPAVAEGMALAALAKREEELYLPGREGAVRLPEDSPGLHLLQRVRDEAHRFVNTYLKKRRSMALREGARQAARQNAARQNAARQNAARQNAARQNAAADRRARARARGAGQPRTAARGGGAS
jgi:excinuclease ABC subunit C